MQVASMDKKRFTLPNWAAYLINAALFAAFIIGGNAVFSSGALPGFITKVAMLIGIQVIAAVSLNISTGYLGQLPLGHAGFMAVGAYASAIFMTRTGISAQLAFPLGIVIGAAVAGLCTGAGTGLLMLFRANRSIRQNLTIMGIMFAVASLSGIILQLITA